MLQAPNLPLHVLNLRFHLPDLLQDLLHSFAVAVPSGFGERGFKPTQFLLEPRQFGAELPELAAVAIIRLLSVFSDARVLPWASGLTAPLPLLRRDVRGERANEG